jgi:uncharacterized glyoxalase superfamily protein PhnB
MSQATDRKSPLLEAAVPILSAEDLASALDYYQRVLGFQVGWTWGDPPHLASVCRDRVEINLGQRGKAGAAGPSKVYFQMSGVDEYYRQVTQAGAVVTVSLGDRPYGMRDFRLQDPSGNELSFGESTVD